MKLRAKRGELRPKPRSACLNQYWGMDMTKILFQDGWGYLNVVNDLYSKEMIGWSFNMMLRTDDCLSALNDVVTKRFPSGIRNVGMPANLITDNGVSPHLYNYAIVCHAWRKADIYQL